MGWSQSGEFTKLPAYISDYNVIGPIAWSPDSQTLVYIQLEFLCDTSGKS
jgi:hypothetical protein